MTAVVTNLAEASKARRGRAKSAASGVQHQSKYLVIETFAYPNVPVHEGERIAFSLGGSPVWFSRWCGPTGRDTSGRFVGRGSEKEIFLLECGTKYSAAEIKSGKFHLLGPVTTGYVVRTNDDETGGVA